MKDFKKKFDFVSMDELYRYLAVHLWNVITDKEIKKLRKKENVEQVIAERLGDEVPLYVSESELYVLRVKNQNKIPTNYETL